MNKGVIEKEREKWRTGERENEDKAYKTARQSRRIKMRTKIKKIRAVSAEIEMGYEDKMKADNGNQQ